MNQVALPKGSDRKNMPDALCTVSLGVEFGIY